MSRLKNELKYLYTTSNFLREQIMPKACVSRRSDAPSGLKTALLAQNITLLNRQLDMNGSYGSMTHQPELQVNANSSVRLTILPTVHASKMVLRPELQCRAVPLIKPQGVICHTGQRGVLGHCPNCHCCSQPAMMAFAIPQRPVLSARLQVPYFAPQNPAQIIATPPPHQEIVHHCSGDQALAIAKNLASQHGQDVASLRALIENNLSLNALNQADWRNLINQAIHKADEANRIAMASEALGVGLRKSTEDNRNGLAIVHRNVAELNASIANALSQADQAARIGRHAEHCVQQVDSMARASNAEITRLASDMEELRRNVRDAGVLARQAIDESQRVAITIADVRNIASQAQLEAAAAARVAQACKEESAQTSTQVRTVRGELSEVHALAQRGSADAASAVHTANEAKSLLEAIRSELEHYQKGLKEVTHSAKRSAQIAQDTAAEWQASKGRLSDIQNQLNKLAVRVDQNEANLSGVYDDVSAWKQRTIEAAGVFRSTGVQTR